MRIHQSDHEVFCTHGSIRPLYITAKLFGFFPFSMKIDPNGKRRIYFTFGNFVVFFMQIIVYLIFVYFSIFHDLMENEVISPLLTLGMRMGLVFGLMSSIGFLLADLCNRHLTFDIFNSYLEFDLQMRLLATTLNMNTKFNKICIYIYFAAFIAISCLYTFISYWICTNLYSVDIFFVNFSAFYLSTAAIGVVLSVYAFFLFGVRSRYCLLNETLRKLPITVCDVTVSTKYLTKRVMQLASLYDMLNNILDKINRCYSIQAMMGLAVSFTFVVFSFFSIYRGWITSNVNGMQLQMSICGSMWATFYVCFVLTVLYAGHSTKNEGKFTGVLLHRKINKCYNIQVVDRLMAFSYQISNKTPDANCNLFSFDWTLLFSIVAATSTYIIILIQFDASGYEPLSHGRKNLTSSI